MNVGPPFSAHVTHQDGSVVLRVTGELDLVSAPRLRTTAADLVSGHLLGLTIDLTYLVFADLFGLRALAAVGSDVSEAGGEFHLIGVSEHLLRIIRMAEFDDLARACETQGTVQGMVLASPAASLPPSSSVWSGPAQGR